VRILILIALLAGVAEASPREVDLRARGTPTPRTLRMRAAQAGTAAPAAEPAVGDAIIIRRRPREEGEKPPLAERVVARIDLGLAVDGARPSGLPNYGGVCPLGELEMGTCVCRDETGTQISCDGGLLDDQYISVRNYGFGELYLGSRGVGADSLNTYFAAQARFARGLSNSVAPIPSPYDKVTDFQTRSAWIESDGLFQREWLRPLRARAGRMFVYGPGIVHLDGLVLAYERSWYRVSTYTGARVPDFRQDFSAIPMRPDVPLLGRGSAIGGSEIRVDLRRFGIPMVLRTSTLRYLEADHSDLEANWVPRPTIVIRSSTRFQDRALARQRLIVRARVSESSQIMLDTQLRTVSDWFWDYASISTQEDLAARTYLDLGPVRPRFQTALQAGTVLFQNVDLLARGAVALDAVRGAPDEDLNPSLPEYIEGGAGIEVRLRRALAIQASALIRDYRRPFTPDLVDTDGEQLLPRPHLLGEEYLVEAGIAARYSGGARRYSANGELYGRQTRWAPVYQSAPDVDVDTIDRHGGGRFWVEAWVNPRVRLRGEYDLTTLVDFAPEFRGLKTLRLFLEGTY
jgi:hypothetical protein